MSYLIDTDVISELTKVKPNQALVSWLKETAQESLFISVISIGEIRKGIEKLDSGKKKNQLLTWFEQELLPFFAERILPIDVEVANKWGHICASSQTPVIDALIAATALTHNLKLVSKNIKDFKQVAGLELMSH
jgi:predicted nucleic acid-binding protein